VEHPTDGRPRLFLEGPGSLVDIAMSLLNSGRALIPPPFDRREPPRLLLMGGGRPGHPGRRYAAGRYKGSAMAKRATRRGGNPARSGMPR